MLSEGKRKPGGVHHEACEGRIARAGNFVILIPHRCRLQTALDQAYTCIIENRDEGHGQKRLRPSCYGGGNARRNQRNPAGIPAVRISPTNLTARITNGWSPPGTTDMKRTPEMKKRYNGVWPAIRRRYITAHPLCEMCRREGRITPAAEVHHILPLADGGTHDPENLMDIVQWPPFPTSRPPRAASGQAQGVRKSAKSQMPPVAFAREILPLSNRSGSRKGRYG